jgi:transposase
MVTVELKEIIRREHLIKGKSIRQIARELNHSRKTIRKALMDPGIPVYTRKEPVVKPVMGPYLSIIKQWLEEDRRRPVKQRHTAKRIHDRLKEEYGFPGGERTVRREVSILRQKVPDSHVPQTYQPGDGATFDFGEAQVIVDGQERTVHLACMRLDYSSKFFVFALPTERREGLFESHIDAFQYLDGVPERIRYDNMKQAVGKILKGKNRQEQSLWVAFRSHFLFEADYCAPGKGQEKGGVENLVGYVRRNFFVPMPEVADFAELNVYLSGCCERDARGRKRWGKTVHELWLEEKEKLRPLPQKMPEACVPVAAKVNRRQMVRFASNWYSVPPQYVGKTVTVKAFVFQVMIALAEKVIAVHARSYERDEEILDPHHYLPVLLRKPGAFERATPIIAWPLPPAYDAYRRRLKERHEGSRGIKEYIRVLMLLKDHPMDEVTTAVEKALSCGISSYDGVINLLDQMHQPETESVSLPVNSPSVWPNRVDQFDLLLGA